MKKIERQGLNVSVQPVSETFFNLPGVTENEKSPQIPKKGDHQGYAQDGHAQEKEGVTRGGFDGQEIDGLLDDQRDDELEKIHSKQTDQSQSEGPAILNKICFNGQEIFKCL
jgi:hypothetical protein